MHSAFLDFNRLHTHGFKFCLEGPYLIHCMRRHPSGQFLAVQHFVVARGIDNSTASMFGVTWARKWKKMRIMFKFRRLLSSKHYVQYGSTTVLNLSGRLF